MLRNVAVLCEHVQILLELGVIIWPYASSYSSLIFLVPKEKYGLKPVMDYCAMNEKIHVDSLSLLYVLLCHLICLCLGFFFVDLNSACHQKARLNGQNHLMFLQLIGIGRANALLLLSSLL